MEIRHMDTHTHLSCHMAASVDPWNWLFKCNEKKKNDAAPLPSHKNKMKQTQIVLSWNCLKIAAEQIVYSSQPVQQFLDNIKKVILHIYRNFLIYMKNASTGPKEKSTIKNIPWKRIPIKVWAVEPGWMCGQFGWKSINVLFSPCQSRLFGPIS